jgi:PAT family beta-lactamase induction signal transducer AmpG
MTRHAPPWLVGITYLPFGLFSGFYIVAMPFLLSTRGMRTDAIGAITTLILIPTFTSFLIAPLVDCGLQRRTWALLWAAITALCLIGGVLSLEAAANGHIAACASFLFTGSLTVQLYSSTMGGMTPNLIAPKDTGRVSAWLNIANLGGIGVGGQIAISLIHLLGTRLGACTDAALIFAPALLLLVVGAEDRVPRAVAETMRRLFHDLWQISRTRSAFIGLLIFITPSATFAGFNLFSSLGADFHTSSATTTWLTGLGNTLFCCLGAVLGGWLSNRLDRRILFVATGMVAAIGSLGMAFGPHTAIVFCTGVSFYYLLAGINFVACSAAAFDIMGIKNPLSATQYALLMAACNVAIETVTTSDARSYAHFGARGFFLCDALLSLITGTIMLFVIHFFSSTRTTPAPQPVAAL